MGAALAYYTLFSIAPLLLIVIAVAGLVFGATAVFGELQNALSALGEWWGLDLAASFGLTTLLGADLSAGRGVHAPDFAGAQTA